MKLVLVMGFLVLLAGCGSWQTNQVTAVNWYKIGYKEAQMGYTANWRTNYHNILGGHPESFDNQEYIRGFKSGYQEACDQGQCPGSIEVADRD